MLSKQGRSCELERTSTAASARTNEGQLPVMNGPEPIGMTNLVPIPGHRRISTTVLRPSTGQAGSDKETKPQSASKQPDNEQAVSEIEPEQTLQYPEPLFTTPWTSEVGLRWVRDQQIAYARTIEPSAPGKISVYEWHLCRGFHPDFELLKGLDNIERWCEHMSRVFDREGLSYLVTRSGPRFPKIPDHPIAPTKMPSRAMASPEDLLRAKMAQDVYRQRVNVRQKMIQDQHKHEKRKAYAMQLLRSAVHPQLRAQHLDPKETEPFVYWMSICKMIHQTRASVIDRFASEHRP